MLRICAFLVLINTVSCAREESVTNTDSSTVIPWTIHSRPIVSTIVCDTFIIDVSLPDSYDSASASRYPVLYLTDGNWRRGQHSTLHTMAKNEGVQEMIIVGIGYPGSYDPNVIRVRDLIDRADNYLSFILHEVIPFVDSTYRTKPTERMLWGSSYGGYFAMYALFHCGDSTKDVFKNYIVASAAAFVNTPYHGQGLSLFDYESMMDAETHDLNISLYLTVGGNETQVFIDSFNQLVSLLERRKYHDFFFTSYMNPGKDHYTVWEPTLYEGVRMYLKK